MKDCKSWNIIIYIIYMKDCKSWDITELSIYLSIYLFIYLFIYLSIYQNISGINNTQASSEIWFSRRPLATANLAVAPKSVAQGTEHCLPSSEFNHPFEG